MSRTTMVLVLAIAGCAVTTDENLWKGRDGRTDTAVTDAIQPGEAMDGPIDGSTDGGVVGSSCTSGQQCQSGHCVDHVCCDTSCTGLCMACDLQNIRGTCTAIAAGNDPDSECSSEPVSTCGRDGRCDGNGACRLHPSGTRCEETCSEPNTILTKECDGSGQCLPAGEQACGSYRCSTITDACYTSCFFNSQCYKYNCGSNKKCLTSCNNSSSCQSGYSCENHVCQ